MPVYAVTGKLGAGKTLVAVGIMRDALNQGRKVATNIDLWLENMINPQAKNVEAYRLPDKVNAKAIDLIGFGSDEFGEENNGCIVIDEGALQLNSRNYRDKGRQEFIDWLVHARKKRWNVYIIIQHVESLDKQIRDLFIENTIYCLRTDRLKMPVVSTFLAVMTLGAFTSPRLHIGITRYGTNPSDSVIDRTIYRGDDLFNAYDTEQKFDFDDESGVQQYLPPYYVVGRYQSTGTSFLEAWYRKIANFSKRPHYKRQFFLIVVTAGLLLGRYQFPSIPEQNKTPVQTASLSTAKTINSESVKEEPKHPLHGLALSGAFVSDNQYYYFWQKNGQATKPPFGYKLIPVSEFKAILQKDGRMYEITKEPFTDS